MSIKKTEQDHLDMARSRLVAAALPHVVFDGWSDATFAAAIEEAGIDRALARQACPRGAMDVLLAFHRNGDAQMIAAVKAALTPPTIRAKIGGAIQIRLQLLEGSKEAVRRGAAFFALPQNAGDGSAALWQTCDLIWSTVGDTSVGLNWYSKRVSLSAVYSATLLFWLGDTSEQHADTWAFLDRRIENIMEFEKLKSRWKDKSFVQKLIAQPLGALERLAASNDTVKRGLPGFQSGGGKN